MMIVFAGIIGGWEIVLILAVVLILFGAKKLPELAKGLGQGIKEFKKATREVTEEISHAAAEDDYNRTYQPPRKEIPGTHFPAENQPENKVAQSTANEPKTKVI